MGFGMLPAQPVFQQQYLPPTNSYQHGYPTTPVTTASNIYQQQVTPDVYLHYPTVPNSYQPQYLAATQDPYQQHQSQATVSPSAYQQLSVSSTTAGGQEQCPVSSTNAITTFHSMNQNDGALNASHYAVQSQDGHVNEQMPCKIKYHRNAQSALPSSEINKQSLRSIQVVLEENMNLRTESCAGKLCQRLAREAIFGEEVMKKCTPYGTRESPGLPRAELYELKMIMFNQFPRFHRCPSLFEDVWKKCIGCVEQACRRIRLKERKS